MDPVLLILKRDLVIANIHLTTEINEMQPSYQKKSGEQRTMMLSRPIKWSIVFAAPSYHRGGSRCNLYLAEKLTILSGDRKIMLNKRSEIVNTCHHRKKFN